jgi:two-component system response regulator FlrC
VERVGGKKPVSLDIRVIATSNRDMAEAVGRGAFREDLYYRLNVFPILIPALRQRPADIVPLARHFLVEHGSRLGRQGLSFTPEAEAVLVAHAWPGNVRELENVVQRAIILAPDRQIGAVHLGLQPAPATRTFPLAPAASATSPAEPPALASPENGKRLDNMRDLEREHILRTLAEVKGSRRAAVERLGISERTLRYKLKQYREEGYLPASENLA